MCCTSLEYLFHDAALTDTTVIPTSQITTAATLLLQWSEVRKLHTVLVVSGTAVAHWLRCCATNRKVSGSIPAGVSGVFIGIKSFRSHYGPGVDSASNRNEYKEYFLG